MRTIKKNTDIKYFISNDTRFTPIFKVKFYTNSQTFSITKTHNDVITEDDKKYIPLQWSELSIIGNGVLNAEVFCFDSDNHFNDNFYNSFFSTTTNFFIEDSFVLEAIDDKEVDSISDRLTKLEKAQQSPFDSEKYYTKKDIDGKFVTDDKLREYWGNEIDVINGDISEAYKKSDNNKKSIEELTKKIDNLPKGNNIDTSNLATKNELNMLNIDLGDKIDFNNRQLTQDVNEIKTDLQIKYYTKDELQERLNLNDDNIRDIENKVDELKSQYLDRYREDIDNLNYSLNNQVTVNINYLINEVKKIKQKINLD